MKKPIYLGEGIYEQLIHFADSNIKEQPLTSNFLIMGSKMHEIYKLLLAKEHYQIDPDLADLKIKAIQTNTYMYPGWDYSKYPQVDLDNVYNESFTNEKFEEVDKDVYNDPILIFIGREGDL